MSGIEGEGGERKKGERGDRGEMRDRGERVKSEEGEGHLLEGGLLVTFGLSKLCF
jgi:hypothetical protein